MPFTYPTAVEFSTVEPDLVRTDRNNRLGHSIFPVVTRNAGKIRWTQKDNYTGLQHIRGLDGKPMRVHRVGARTYEYEPGVFGEYVDITETELTNRASGVDLLGTNISIDDLVAEADVTLIGREGDRIENSIWDVLINGTITIAQDSPTGMVLFRDTFVIQTYTSVVPWATHATATPLEDLMDVALLGTPAGNSNNLGTGATAYMNLVTANHLLLNRNADDLYGRLVSVLGIPVPPSMTEINRVNTAQGLPAIVIYDGGYLNDSSVWTKFIPDNRVVVVGSRPSNAPVGNYLLTRNLNNPGGSPGSYRYVVDRTAGINGEKRTPPNIEIHRGHNGGPIIWYPGAVVSMDV